MDRDVYRRRDIPEGQHGRRAARRGILRPAIARFRPKAERLSRLEAPATQIVRFAIVGGGATLIHLGSALALNGFLGLSPLRANFCAFLVAFAFSYSGNFIWTFEGASAHVAALPRFLMLQITLFAINQAMVYVAVDLWGWPFFAALIPVVTILPAGAFLASRFWAFLPWQSEA
jgi:putative flippase GtrA